MSKPHQAREARRPRRSSVDLADFKSWLAGLDVGVIPTIHVNGHQYTQAVLAVDFGQPLRPAKLTPEQSQDLIAYMRRATADIVGREVNCRISYDHQHGVYWASI